MEKFTVKVQKKREPVRFKPIQVYEETNKIVESVIEVTNSTKAQTIHEMITFAYEHMEIIKEEEE